MTLLINAGKKARVMATQKQVRDLEKRVAFYERILNEVPAAIYISEPSRRIVWCNKTFEGISGYTLDELREKGEAVQREIVHADDMRIPEGQIVYYRNFFGLNFGGVYRLRHRLDTAYKSFISWTKNFDADEAGNPKTVLSIDLDINRLSPMQKQLTAALKDGLRVHNEHLAENLTPREKEILRLICSGKSNREISEKLFLSLFTIDTHRKNIRRKLQAHNSAELTKKAREIGLD